MLLQKYVRLWGCSDEGLIVWRQELKVKSTLHTADNLTDQASLQRVV